MIPLSCRELVATLLPALQDSVSRRPLREGYVDTTFSKNKAITNKTFAQKVNFSTKSKQNCHIFSRINIYVYARKQTFCLPKEGFRLYMQIKRIILVVILIRLSNVKYACNHKYRKVEKCSNYDKKFKAAGFMKNLWDPLMPIVFLNFAYQRRTHPYCYGSCNAI